MIARVLEQAGRDPTVLIGGEVDDFGGNARAGRGEDVVAEVDESDGSLLHVVPQIAVLTNFDGTDHLDFYGTMEPVVQPSRRFLGRLPAGGLAIICADPAAARTLAQDLRHGAGAKVITYGLEADADYRARVLEMAGARSVFEVWRGNDVL